MRGDLKVRLGPFTASVLLVWLAWRPAWLGLAPGDLRAQLLFGGIGCVALFLCAVALQLPLTRRRGGLRVGPPNPHPSGRSGICNHSHGSWHRGRIERSAPSACTQSMSGSATALLGST